MPNIGVKRGLSQFPVSSSTSSSTSQKHNGEITDIVKPFDWTYTTAYKGDVVLPNAKFKSSNAKMPLEKLQRQDPILFYDEVVLFEDELADNGTALLTIKVVSNQACTYCSLIPQRVMPTSFFVLQRFFLRVDDVLFRVFDTRLYHEFASFPTPPADAIYQTSILREYIQREDEHQAVVKVCHVTFKALLILSAFHLAKTKNPN